MNRKIALFLLVAGGINLNAWAESGCDENQPQTTASNFFDQIGSAGTVVDTRTGLQWLRCPLGQQWQAHQGSCEPADSASSYSWTEALLTADEFEYAGHSDWRLPNKKELATIVEYQCREPAINQEIFPDTASETFWTSTPVPYASPISAWSVRFSDGGFLFENVSTSSNHVRLVRDTQN